MLPKLLKKTYFSRSKKNMRAGNFTKGQLEAEKAKLQRIESGHGWKEVKACPLCGYRKRTQELIKYKRPLVRCGRCDLRYHKSIPTNLDDVYKDPAYEIFTTAETKKHF